MNIPLILSVLSFVLCVCFFFYFRFYIKRKTAAEQLLAEYRTEVYRLIAEIDAATDRDSQLVEERIKTLKSLLADTDKRIAVYLRELERSRTGEALYTSLGRGIRAAINPQPQATPGPEAAEISPPETAAEQTPVVAGTGSDQRTGQPPSSPVPPPTPQDAAPQNAIPAPQAPNHARSGNSRTPASSDNSSAKPRLKVQIAELAAGGLSPAQIASQLNISRSEVELALNLLNRQ